MRHFRHLPGIVCLVALQITAFLRLAHEKLLRLVLPLRRIRGKGWAALDVFAEVEVIH